MNIALFTKCFLEPTHVAIAQVLRGLPELSFRIFAKAYDTVPGFPIPNATAVADLSRETCDHERARDCAIVHAIYDGHVAFDAFQLSRKLNLPFILSFHGGFDTNVKIWKPSARDMTRTIAEHATVVTVVAESDVMRLRSLGVTRQIEVVPVPVDLSCLPKADLMVSRGELVTIGRLIPKKGCDIAITALSHLPMEFRLRLIGSGPEHASLVSLANRLGVADRVEFLGFLPIPAMLSALGRARVMLHPARVAEDGNAEGTPQALLWAFALGVPVVAGDSGSIKDIVMDGRNGLTVTPNDPHQLASIAHALACDEALRSQIIPAAREWVKGRHDLPAVLERWRQIYLRASRGVSCALGNADSVSLLIATKPARFKTALNAALASFDCLDVTCSLIESGGQGMIFLARLPTGERSVVKVANYSSEEPADIELTEHRLRKEALILAELQRRNCNLVPRIRQFDAGGRFLVREYFPGATIQDAALNLHQSDKVRLLPVLARTCELLFEAFHGASEPHVIRDLKPKNLVLGPDDRIVLVDVGSVRASGRRSKSNRRKMRLGTRNWLHWSPELLISQGLEADQRSDFFSFGTTAFFFVLSRAPYSNSESDPLHAMERYCAEYDAARRDWLSQCKMLGVAAPLAKFVASCLSPLPDDRPNLFSLSNQGD